MNMFRFRLVAVRICFSGDRWYEFEWIKSSGRRYYYDVFVATLCEMEIERWA